MDRADLKELRDALSDGGVPPSDVVILIREPAWSRFVSEVSAWCTSPAEGELVDLAAIDNLELFGMQFRRAPLFVDPTFIGSRAVRGPLVWDETADISGDVWEKLLPKRDPTLPVLESTPHDSPNPLEAVMRNAVVINQIGTWWFEANLAGKTRTLTGPDGTVLSVPLTVVLLEIPMFRAFTLLLSLCLGCDASVPAGVPEVAAEVASAATVVGDPGRVEPDPAHPAWLRYSTGKPFFMCGPGDPEGFLYRGTLRSNGTRDGDQLALIAKLGASGANCVYVIAIRSHGGDGDSRQNPYIGGNLGAGALDEELLGQWGTWFTALDDANVVTFFVLYDDNAEPFGKELPSNKQLKPAEIIFIDAMVARFKHHKRWIWCVAEEYREGLSSDHAVKIAERIQQRDDQHHVIAIHENNSTSFDFRGSPFFQQFAVQKNVDTAVRLHTAATTAWENVHGLVNINVAEFAGAGAGATLRKKVWAIAMGGGYSMVLGMDIAGTSNTDLLMCGRLRIFMESTRFNETAPHDELRKNDTKYVLAKPGQVYLAYLLSGSTFGLTMEAGTYAVKWYDVVADKWYESAARSVGAGTQTWVKPAGTGSEVVLYLTRI